MASSSSSSSLLEEGDESSSIKPELLRLVVTLINQHLDSLLSNPKSRKILQIKCASKLINIQPNHHKMLKLSQQSAVSNLQLAIENVEAAVESHDRNSRLKNAIKMLQAPAMLNQNGVTAGIPNYYLICWSYFYLSVVSRMQKDEVKAAVHFLEALLASPGLVRSEVAPELYEAVVERCILALRPPANLEGVKWGATSFKAWLMYHQVISYGQSPLFMKHHHHHHHISNTKVCATSSSNSQHVHLHQSRTFHNLKVHPVDPQEHVHGGLLQEKGNGENAEKSSNVKRLQDILMEYQSDSPTSLYSGTSDFSDGDSEEFADEYDRSLRNLRVVDEIQPESSQAPENSFYKENVSNFSRTLSSSSSDDLDFWKPLNEEDPGWESYQISEKSKDEISFCPVNSYRIEQAEILEKVISKLCFSQGQDEDSTTVEITTIYEMLASKSGFKYSLLKDMIIDQLIMAISTSKEEGVTRASVSILSSIISRNPSVIYEIKKKGLRLSDLANALKRNVYEAAILIYLMNPSPADIKNLELLPTLVKIVGTSNHYLKSHLVTPHSASLMIIEVLVTEFDYATNDTHLAAISSEEVISCLVDVPRNGNLEELVSLAVILIKLMRFNGRCRNYILRFIPITLFISLILSNKKRALLVGLEFYHEILHMPRSSCISRLQQLREGGGINIMRVLFLAIQEVEQEHKLLAANLLLQLDVLEESLDEFWNGEVAIEALLESLTCEENLVSQKLSAFILSNLGGTYASTGEPYTIAWLVKKAGLTSLLHKNIVKNVDWSDNTLQEKGTDFWCSKVTRQIIKLGNPVFYALEKGLKSKNKSVSKNCLTTIAWIGCEIVKGTHDDLRLSACEILLSTIQQYVHPGIELELRLLACLSIYNYTSGRGMHKLIQLSEGVRESLRRLSSITWMAEELLKVADYYMPNKWRICCVHTQVVEASHSGSGAVNCLIYYMGQLFSGYADGSIKVWDIKGQTTTLVLHKKEHKKAVTCFSLFEPGNCLLTGSADKTIRIWQMVERKLQCIEVITTKETIQSLETSGELIFAVTRSHMVKVLDSSRKLKELCKSKHVKCIRANQGKVYIGCMDSRIQELTIGTNRQQEVKPPSKSWRMHNKPINSIAFYKDWLYSASTCVDGSTIKEWKIDKKARLSVIPEKRANVAAMCVVEDFIYLNCTSSASNLEIWLRGTQQKVGRLSTGSKITSLLAANDMVICGTETGLIKGWIPL